MSKLIRRFSILLALAFVVDAAADDNSEEKPAVKYVSADDIPFDNDELIELHRQIRDGEWDDEQLAEIVPRLILSCRPDANAEMSMLVLSTLHEREPKIVRPHLPSFAPLIGVVWRERRICKLCSFFMRLGETPPEVVAAFAERFSERDERDFFANGMMAALLLMDSPENAEVRKWLEQEIEHENQSHRLAALNAISSIGDAVKRSLPVIEQRLKDESPAVRVAAASAVSQFGSDVDAAVHVLLVALEEEGETYVTKPLGLSEWWPDHRHIAIVALGKIGDHKADIAPKLIPYLADGDDIVQYMTLKSLAQLNHRSTEVIDAVRTKTHDQERFIANEASETLKQLSADHGG